MTTAAAIVDAIYGINYRWRPDTRRVLEKAAEDMLLGGLPAQEVASLLSTIVDAMRDEYGS